MAAISEAAKQHAREHKREYWLKNKESLSAKNRAYYQRNRERCLELQKRWSRNRDASDRAAVLAHYGHACACCGETTYEFLCVDHINGGGSKHKREIGGHIYDWLVKNNFPEGFQILCHNCNMAKGFYGICPHKKINGN